MVVSVVSRDFCKTFFRRGVIFFALSHMGERTDCGSSSQIHFYSLCETKTFYRNIDIPLDELGIPLNSEGLKWVSEEIMGTQLIYSYDSMETQIMGPKL